MMPLENKRGCVGDKVGMDSNSSDAEVLAYSAVEPSAFAILFERHHIAVRRYVARRVGSDAGDDLAAEVFTRAFRGRERCRAEQASALPWLLGVANHVVADHRRTEQRRLKALQRLAASAPQLVEHEDRALSAELVRELRRLSGEDRDALLLVVWGELSYEEAATALQVPIGTVKSRIARARRVLAADIDPLARRRPVELSETKLFNA
jgi:RNA polymerase sigma-70 factor (ECF subfamily)